ncbi:DUF6177 family protein [Streptomyces sp. NPDC093586]
MTGPRPARLGGTARRAALHYRLGDGVDAEGWGRLRGLLRHLRGEAA